MYQREWIDKRCSSVVNGVIWYFYRLATMTKESQGFVVTSDM